MRRAVGAGWIALVAGCATTPSAGDDGGASPVDAASGPQPVGAACDPALTVPCLPTGDPCLGVQCDPVALVCAPYVEDAGPTCSGGTVACTTTADCDLGLACGFPIGGGCGSQGAAGTCLNPPLLCQDDASTCGSGGTTCDCSGVQVPILVLGYASAPTPSGGGCEADGGGDGGDGGGAG